MRYFSTLRHFCVPIGLWMLLNAGSLLAQTPPESRPTLAASLAEVTPPVHGMILSVDTEKVALPEKALLPGTKPTVEEIASVYGRAKQEFGVVTALAPPTMTVLNTAPGEPNIYASMPAMDAFTLLAASLNDAQWHALTSETGLGVTDLNPTQQQLFGAMLSHNGKLLVMPQYAEGEKQDGHDQRDLTDQLPQAHLRVGQTVTFSLPPKDQPGTSYGDAAIPPPPGAPRQYEIAAREDYGGSSDADYGAVVRADLPNVPKRGQLNFAAPALRMAVSLDGLKTVGDLVYRIGSITHTEIYVDPRMEKMTLTLSGLPSAPASDLLRSLAFCLTGTFRQVGPAYVLTDDIVGIGTRRQIWAEFEEEANSLRRGPVTAASNALYTNHIPRDLPWFGAPGAYTPTEIKSAGPQASNTQDGFLPELTLPFAALTPDQQDMAQRGVEKWNREYTLQPVTTDGKITVRPALSVQLLVSSVNTPIDLNLNHGGTEQYFVFQMPQEIAQARMKAMDDQRMKEHPEWAAALARMSVKAPLADVWATLKPISQRAAIIHPRTAKDADKDIAAAKALGLNELWLDVFSNGTAHVPGSALSAPTPLLHGESDILTEALTRTKGTSLRIFPLFDLLFWGQSPPTQDADLNILGETSSQAAARWQQQKSLLPEGQEMSDEAMSNAVIPDWPGVAVCPVAPGVWRALSGLIKTVGSQPGVAGIIWRDTDTPGYDTLPGGSDTSSLLLGYQEDARLAFLRRFHADPVDIYDVGHSGTIANTDLGNFSEGGSNQETYKLHDSWVKFRQDTGLAFLRTLYAAANLPGSPPSHHVQILVKQRRSGQPRSNRSGHTSYAPGWYGSWDNPQQPPPTLHTMGEDDKPGQPMEPVADETTQARSQSHLVLTPITSDTLDQMRTELGFRSEGVYRHTPSGQSLQRPGFVLDLSDDLRDDSPGAEDPLILLAAEIAPVPATTLAKPAAR